MNKNLKEYRLKNGVIVPEHIAKALADISKNLNTGIAKIKAEVTKVRNTRDNK